MSGRKTMMPRSAKRKSKSALMGHVDSLGPGGFERVRADCQAEGRSAKIMKKTGKVYCTKKGTGRKRSQYTVGILKEMLKSAGIHNYSGKTKSQLMEKARRNNLVN